MRSGPGTLDERSGDLLHPLRLDGGHRPGPQPGGLHQFDGDNEFRGLARQQGSGIDGELGAASTDVLLGSRTLAATLRGFPNLGQTDVGEQAGQQCDENTVSGSGGAVDLQVQLLGDLAQLAVQVAPFAHAQVIDVLSPAHTTERRGSHLPTLMTQVAPQSVDGHDVPALVDPTRLGLRGRLARTGIGVRGVTGRCPRCRGVGGLPVYLLTNLGPVPHPVVVGVVDGPEGLQQVRLGGEASVEAVGLLPLLGRALPDIADGQCRDDDEDLSETALFRPLKQHAPQTWIQRDTGKLMANLGQSGSVPMARFEGSQLVEQADSVIDPGAIGRLDEGEVSDGTESSLGHLEDDGGQVGAQDLGLGELGT